MTAPTLTPETLLRLCGDAAPAGWFPSQYARDTGADRDSLDEPLNRLRLAGLVEIGGWEPGRGQCYVLTAAGRAALADPRALARLHDGHPPAPAPVVPPPRASRASAWGRGEMVRAAFFADSASAPVLYALILVQVIVFAAGLSVVVRRGAPVGKYLETGLALAPGGLPVSPMEPLVLTTVGLARGQWWRLLTYALVHYGALHLAMNLYGHFALGALVERMYGSVRFLVLYLLSALGGGVAAALLSPVVAATAGSSGALCGMIGGFASFVLLNRGHLGKELFDHCRRWLGNTIILLVLFSMLPHVSWQGHLGGFVGGAVAGVLLTYHRFGTAEQRWAALLGLVLLPIAGVAPLVERNILRLPRPAADRELGGLLPGNPIERNDFVRRVVTPVEPIRLRAAAVMDNFIGALRDQPAEARDPTRVQAGRALLAVLKHDQDAARTQVEQAGPYQDPTLERARRAAAAYLGAAAAVTVALDACLARGPNWQVTGEQGTTDEARLQQLSNDALEAELRWKRLAGAAARGGANRPGESAHLTR